MMRVYMMLMMVNIIMMMTMVTRNTFPMEWSVPGNGDKDSSDQGGKTHCC